jgi:hypothetical protein
MHSLPVAGDWGVENRADAGTLRVALNMLGHPQRHLEAIGNLDLLVDAVEVGFDGV